MDECGTSGVVFFQLVASLPIVLLSFSFIAEEDEAEQFADALKNEIKEHGE